MNDSTREEPFQELNFSLESSVEKALHVYSAKELMTGDHQYQCDVCARKCDAERSVKIKAPKILQIQLLRYQYDDNSGKLVKLTPEVIVEDTLVVSGEEFKLVSVLYHLGNSLNSGHYVCDALDWYTDEWWHFDDATVRMGTVDVAADAGMLHPLTLITST